MTQTKRSPILLELIIVIGFFSVALAVVVQIFALVHTQNRAVIERNNAIIAMQDCAEQLKGDPTLTLDAVYYYDEDFLTQIPAEQSTRMIEISITPQNNATGTLYEILITAYRTDADTGARTELAQLRTAIYQPLAFAAETGGDANE